MTNTKEKEVNKKAIELIDSLRNDPTNDFAKKEALDYIKKILKGYNLFKENCTKWEYCYDLEFDHTVKLKYKDIHSFAFMKELTLYLGQK